MLMLSGLNINGGISYILFLLTIFRGVMEHSLSVTMGVTKHPKGSPYNTPKGVTEAPLF